MDLYTHSTFQVQKGRGLGSRDLITNFWDPINNFWTNWASRFKFGTEMETELSCVRNIKRPISGRGLGHVTQFRNFGTPFITFERIELSASNLVQKWRTDPFCVWTWKWPLSGCGPGQGHLTQFRNFGTPYNWQNIKGKLQVYEQ